MRLSKNGEEKGIRKLNSAICCVALEFGLACLSCAIAGAAIVQANVKGYYDIGKHLFNAMWIVPIALHTKCVNDRRNTMKKAYDEEQKRNNTQPIPTQWQLPKCLGWTAPYIHSVDVRHSSDKHNISFLLTDSHIHIGAQIKIVRRNKYKKKTEITIIIQIK